jgi:hypothetical protein
MEKFRDGEWYIFKEKTRKPFGRLMPDASRGLFEGLSSFFTTHKWEKNVCHISAPGTVGEVIFEKGERGWNVVTCRVRFTGLLAAFLKNKTLSDIEHTTAFVCGAVSAENRNVFIVHGHSDAHKHELAAFLRTLELQPVVLDEEDDLGMTIIEKFEYHASDCAFAFVLMTPDDFAGGKSRPDSHWRARQNVIMELGWFMAHLGRERVVILYTGDLEIPSDILGVVYLRFDQSLLEVQEKIKQRLRGALLMQ